MNAILKSDLALIRDSIGSLESKFEDKRICITGGAGFLGYYFLNYFLDLNQRAFRQPCKVVCIDNFIRGLPDWMVKIRSADNLTIIEGDIAKVSLADYGSFDYIIHAASIASPTYYRRYPIETIDANVGGLKALLDYSHKRKLSNSSIVSMLYFSSSEIYGNPNENNIPTSEDYNGNVSCTGPRACYDESKRLGETLCVAYNQVHGVPVKIVRPFNNYGPGLRIDDRRVISDFCRNVLNKEDIVLLSDGLATRTFCYIADAITGYLLALLSDHDGEAFNIGTEAPEISMEGVARLVIEVAEETLNANGLKVIKRVSDEKDYLTDNPSRRCPRIQKARDMLGYSPVVDLKEGLRRSLVWYATESNNEISNSDRRVS